MDRLSWYFEQQVGQADLNLWEDDIENSVKAVISDILGFGFLISGTNPASLVQDTPLATLNVKANQFLGYDQFGGRLSNLRSAYQGGVNKGAPPPQRIDCSVDENSVSTAVAGGGNEKSVAVFVKFTRNPSVPRVDGNSSPLFYHQDESCEFHIVQSAEAAIGASVKPPLRTDQILLFDTILIKKQTQIVNGGISIARQQAFQLHLPHGPTHVETGSDPVPNATGAVGGLMSGADKTKLDLITSPFSAWIGAQIPNRMVGFQVSDGTAPSATTLDVTSKFTGQAANGSTSKEAVVTQTGAPDNRVDLRDGSDNEIQDAGGNRVYGRVTVDNETTPTTWTLHFYSEIAGVETIYDFTAQSGLTLKIIATKAWRLDHLPANAPAKPFIRNQAVPLPTTGLFPIGGCFPYMAPVAGSPLPAAPAGFEYCDGGSVSTGGSPLLTRTKPALMKTPANPGTALRFVRGADVSVNPYGGANVLVNGGSDTHAHGAGSLSTSISGTTGAGGAHHHSISNYSHTHTDTHVAGVFNNSSPAGTLSTDNHAHGGQTGDEASHQHSFSGSGAIGGSTDTQPNVPAHVLMAWLIRCL